MRIMKNISIIPNNRFEVKTPIGWCDFDAVLKKESTSIISIFLDNGKSIECSPNHKLKGKYGWFQATDVERGDELDIHGSYQSVEFVYSDNKLTTVYDLRNVKNVDHSYYTNDFTSHNCEFLGSSLTLVNVNVLRNLTFVNPKFTKNNFDQYEDILPNHEYVITVDTSRGVGLDNSAFAVIDITEVPYRVVAKFKDPHISPMMYPEIIYTVAKNYNDAFVLVEVNDIGEQVANILYRDLEYENLFQTTPRGRKGQVIGGGFGKQIQMGVRTTTQVKAVGCSTLKDMVENQKLIIQDFDMIEELSNFILKKGSYEADEGYHDDLVMCLVLFGWLTRQEYFKDLTNTDIRQKLLADKEAYMEEEMLPFGFYNDGSDNIQTTTTVSDYFSLEDMREHSNW